MCVAKPEASRRRHRAAQRFERCQDLARAGLGSQLDRLAHVVSRFLTTITPVGDMRQRGEHGGSIASVLARNVECLAQDAFSVVQLTALGKGLAELATKNDHGSHRVVQLASKELATCQPQGTT